MLESIKKAQEPERKKVEEAYAQGAQTFKETVLPAAQNVKAAAAVPSPPMPHAVPQPPVPDLKPRPFLSAEGKQALPALVSAMGLLATTIMGARNAPQAGLFALTGAMNGWAEGDHIRADRSWREYLGYVDKVKKENDQQWHTWEAAMESSNMNLMRAQAQFAVASVEAKRPEYAIAAAERGMQYVEKDIATSKNIVEMMMRQSETLSRDRFNEWARTAEIQQRQRDSAQREAHFQQTRTDKKAEQDALLDAYPPETLTTLGQQWFTEGKLPGNIARGGKSVILPKIFAAGRQWAVDHGIDPDSSPVVRENWKAAARANASLAKQEAEFRTYLISFERTLDQTKALSDKVDRGSVPAWNRRKLEYQANVKGDPDAKNLLSQMEILARDADRVLARAKGVGAEQSRQEARRLMDPGMTKEQFDSLSANVLKRDAINAVAGFTESRQIIQDTMDALGGGKGKQPGGGGSGGSDGGKSYTLDDGTKVTVK
jgi:hypothetical protein